MDAMLARLQKLEDEVVELRRRVQQLEGGTAHPTAETPLVAQLLQSAPPSLAADLQPTLQALSQTDDPRAIAQLVVEIVELCEESRRDADLSTPFYEDLEERLTRITQSADLEPLSPGNGQPYRPGEHLVVRSVRGGQRDLVERCLKRGFRWQGQLLKKAEVSVYL